LTITIKDININYKQEGMGEDILILHGWGYDSSLLEPLFNSLAQNYRVTMLDFPAHGGTPAPEQAYTVYDFAELAIQFMQAIGIKKTNIIAHSFGCRIAIIIASKQSNLINKIVLCGAAGIRPARTLKYYYKVYSYKGAKKLLSLPIFSEKQREKWQAGKGSEDYRNLSGVMRQTFSQVVNEDLTSFLSNIKAPTLLIWGAQDEATPLYMGRLMEKLIPDAALVLYENATHYAFLEQLPRTIKIVNAFFGGQQ